MPRNRKKFNEIAYKVFAVYNDETEELIKTFKYKKAADRFVADHTVDNGRFEVREVPVNVL